MMSKQTSQSKQLQEILAFLIRVMGQQGPTNAVSVAGVRVQEWKFSAYALPVQKEYAGEQILSCVKTSMGMSNFFSV